ncbi:hypothetical protein JG688_00012172 [Phytophthora aleatoria]|uniref:Uncharacterized protein n=1 Tax=Phytophthora aleatoria TaxID=2496075 RepID=A0A8J5MEG3_9STRA|nr:hypothetical protein JG688_00012172 [Phytophthora aleatoria]
MNDLRLPARPLTLGRPPQVKPVIEKIGCCITKCLWPRHELLPTIVAWMQSTE